MSESWKVLTALKRLWGRADDDSGSVKHTDLEMWRQLSTSHWNTMFGYYNISINGK